MTIILGQEYERKEYACIVDDDGGIDVELSFIRANEDWYSYTQTVFINNDIVHCYRLIQ